MQTLNKPRVIVICGEVHYMRAIILLTNSLNTGVTEIINAYSTVGSIKEALSIIKAHKPDIILLDHFLSKSMNGLEKIKLEDGEGIKIAEEINFFYIGEIKPVIISISSCQRKYLEPLYEGGVKHFSEGDTRRLALCIKEECSC